MCTCLADRTTPPITENLYFRMQCHGTFSGSGRRKRRNEATHFSFSEPICFIKAQYANHGISFNSLFASHSSTAFSPITVDGLSTAGIVHCALKWQCIPLRCLSVATSVMIIYTILIDIEISSVPPASPPH